LESQYPPGSVLKGKVKNLTDFGLFVGIGNGVDGLIHMSEISWSRRKKVISDMYKKGTFVEALVLNIDKVQKKFSLSLKRLKDDPWRGLSDRYDVGTVIDGFVTSITDFGAFVEIEEGIEGLIHLSEMDDLQGKTLGEVYKIDDPVKVVILNIDEKDKRIGLSVKALKKTENKPAEEPVAQEEGAFSTLGDILQPAMSRDKENVTT
jgi:small subunit ribosomal protein S1